MIEKITCDSCPIEDFLDNPDIDLSTAMNEAMEIVNKLKTIDGVEVSRRSLVNQALQVIYALRTRKAAASLRHMLARGEFENIPELKITVANCLHYEKPLE